MYFGNTCSSSTLSQGPHISSQAVPLDGGAGKVLERHPWSGLGGWGEVGLCCACFCGRSALWLWWWCRGCRGWGCWCVPSARSVRPMGGPVLHAAGRCGNSRFNGCVGYETAAQHRQVLWHRCCVCAWHYYSFCVGAWQSSGAHVWLVTLRPSWCCIVVGGGL